MEQADLATEGGYGLREEIGAGRFDVFGTATSSTSSRGRRLEQLGDVESRRSALTTIIWST